MTPQSRHRHLGDEALLELLSFELVGQESAAAPSVQGCSRCRQRALELRTWLSEVCAAGREREEVFSADRLARQRDQIRRRIEAVHRSAKVLPFPARSQPASAARPRSKRVVAAAAAAGLFIGLAAGTLLDLHPRELLRNPGTPSAGLAQGAAQARQPIGIGSLPAQSDELLLLEIDAALDAPRARALEPLDALTPRVVDVAYNLP